MGSSLLFPNAPNSWKRTTLGELAKESGGNIQTGPFGSQLHASDYVDYGVPSIMPKNITIDYISTEEIARVSTADIERLSKYRVKVGDIIYSRRGDVEKCARITNREDGWLCGTGCLRVRVKPIEVSTEYLHAYLSNPTVREWVVRHAVGATMPNLNTSILSSLPVLVPSKPEMNRIAKNWIDLSSKILVNQQINQTLEQIAQGIFKSWFVDFDPVKAKIAALEAGGSQEDATLAAMQAISGKDKAQLSQLQAENPEQYNELRTTAELFPSAMQDSELGEIPDGWMIGSLSDIARFTNGRVQTSTLNVNNYVSTENMLENKGGIGNASSLPSAEYVPSYEVGHILISNIRPYFRKIWMATHDGGRSPDVLGFESRTDGTHLFLYNFLYQDCFFDYMMLTSKGAKMPRGDKKAIMNLNLLVPPTHFMRTFDLKVSGYYQAIKNRRDESQILAALRDTLLPHLLSGEIEPNQENCD